MVVKMAMIGKVRRFRKNAIIVIVIRITIIAFETTSKINTDFQ